MAEAVPREGRPAMLKPGDARSIIKQISHGKVNHTRYYTLHTKASLMGMRWRESGDPGRSGKLIHEDLFFCQFVRRDAQLACDLFAPTVAPARAVLPPQTGIRATHHSGHQK